MHLLKLIIVFFGLIFSITHAYCASEISIDRLWINEAPPNMSVLAAYGSIKNTSLEDVKIERINSPYFSEIEIHKIITKNDISKMIKQNDFAIKKNSTVEFSPGGIHLMLYEPISPVKKGDAIPFIFYFSNGEQIHTEAIVKKLSESTEHNHHHHK